MDDNTLRLIIKAVDQATTTIEKVKKQVEQLGTTSAQQTTAVAGLDSSLQRLEQQATKTGTSVKRMSDHIFSIRNAYFASFVINNFTFYLGGLAKAFLDVADNAANLGAADQER